MSAIAKYNGVNAFTAKPLGIDTREGNGIYTPNQIPQSGLLLSYDPAHPNSYSGSGFYLYDLTSNNNDTIFVGGLETGYDPTGWFSGDGVNDAVSAAQTFTLTGTKLGIGCWFRLDNDTGVTFSQFNILQSTTVGNATFGFTMRFDGANYQVVARCADGTGVGRNQRTQNISKNTWYYIFAQVDSATNTQTTYLFDSTGLVETLSQTNNLGDWVTNPLTGWLIYVSRASAPAEFTVGETHIYNDKFMTQTEVTSIYENTKKRYGY